MSDSPPHETNEPRSAEPHESGDPSPAPSSGGPAGEESGVEANQPNPDLPLIEPDAD